MDNITGTGIKVDETAAGTNLTDVSVNNANGTVIDVKSNDVSIGNVTVKDSEGTAIKTEGNNTAISGVDITNQTGTGIESSGDNTIISDSVVKNSTGIGIKSNGDNAKLDNITVVGNNGTAVVLNGNNATLENSTIANNTGTVGAGVVSNGNGTTVKNTEFTNNTADSGAGLVLNGKNNLVDNSTFTGNTANTGAGILATSQPNNVINSAFNGNHAQDGSPAIGITKDGYVSVDQATYDKSSDMPIVAKIVAMNATASDAVEGDTSVVINVKTEMTDGEVYVIYNGRKYVAKVNSDGTAIISVPDYKMGNYTTQVYYRQNSSDNNMSTYTNVSFTVAPNLADIIHDNAYIDYCSNYAYKLRIIGVDGKPVGEGIIVKINGKTYKTDSNGYVTIKIGSSYAPGNYKITLNYKGITSTKTITVQKILKVKTIKKSSKQIVLSATLKLSCANKYVNKKDYNKKSPLKNKKITVKFKGKTYKIKTNNKGIAKFTITKKMMKQLKSGKKYKIVFKYGKDIVNRYVKIKR